MTELMCRVATRLAAAAPEQALALVATTLREVAVTLGVEWATVRARSGPPPGGPDQPAWFGASLDAPDLAVRDMLRRERLCSAAIVPVVLADPRPSPIVVLGSSQAGRDWPPETRWQLQLLAAIIGQALQRAEHAGVPLDGLRQPAPTRAAPLPGRSATSTGRISAASESVRRALEQLAVVAPTPSTVLLLGETGAGKEVFAREIHARSGRQQRSMVCVHCAAIPATLLESELFGRERGAYTGASSRQIGRFEAAHRSTIFLDEIGELSAEAQVKLLRVLQERVIERLGSNVPVPVDVRVIAATNRDLAKAVTDGIFREDLFYRLNVFPVHVPSLRERVEDIPALAWQFIEEISGELGKTIHSVAPQSMLELQRYAWPGNVRELRNVIERAVIAAEGPQLTVSVPHPILARQVERRGTTLNEVLSEHIRSTLESTGGRIRGPGGAAERLGLKPTTLETRMAKLGISRTGRAGGPVLSDHGVSPAQHDDGAGIAQAAGRDATSRAYTLVASHDA